MQNFQQQKCINKFNICLFLSSKYLTFGSKIIPKKWK